MAREKGIKGRIVERLNQIPGCYARGIHSSPFSKGWPDVMGSVSGRTLALEVKQPGKKATDLQAAELAKWFKSGAITGVVTSVDEVRDLLRAHGIEAP